LSSEIAALWLAWTTSLDNTSGASPGTSQRAALSYAAQVWPVITALAPESAVEIKAIAAAANQPLLVIVALNCYDEIGLVEPLESEDIDPKNTGFRGHCTGVSLGWDGEGAGVVLGQSWDCPLYYRPVLLLKVVSQDGHSDQVHLTFPGIVAGPCMSTKMAIGWFTVVPTSPRQAGLPNPVLLREALSCCESTAAAMEFFAASKRCAGSCFIVCDAAGDMAAFESDASTSSVLPTRRGGSERNTGRIATDKVTNIASHRATHRATHTATNTAIDSAIDSATTFIVHANHFCAPDLVKVDAGRIDWSTRRHARAESLVNTIPHPPHSAEESFSVIQEILADTHGKEQGVSICEHADCTGGQWETLAAIMFDPQKLQYRVKGGRPDDDNIPWQMCHLGERK